MSPAPMDFRACLEGVAARLQGVVSATLMSTDGLAVATVDTPQTSDEPIDVASLLIELSAVLTQVRQSGQSFAAGGVEELTVRSERLTTLIRPVTPEYFLALALLPGANLGKGRYLLRITAPKLVSELS